MSLMELLRDYPEAAAKLKELGMHCSICMGAASESLEQGIRAHGLDLDETLNMLNEVLKDGN